MAYSKQQYVMIEEYPSNDGFVPDESFVEAWENYLADEDLEEEMEAFCYGRLAVVSDVDDGGFALNVDKELRGSAVL
jgi:hypothetical protein